MRNVFLFIRRYFTFFTFLLLQGVALWFLFSYNRFHRVKFLGIANEMTGRINSQYNKVEDYFNLKEENKRVHRLNDSLMNLLRGNFEKRDTSVVFVKDTMAYDTTGLYRRYFAKPATVVYNTVNSEKNYIQINRGSNQGIRDNSGVISSDGTVVGVVVNVSPNFSQVLSLLHVQSRLVVSLKKSGESGTIEWDGKDPRILILKRMPKTVTINKGDSIVTSGNNTLIFPKGLLVGTVAEIRVDNASGTYMLKINTATNFYSLQQVHVIENIEKEEQTVLLEDTKNKMDQTLKSPR
ncbi:MAG: rod shape-determining protein MreC [Bacteroidetes bacterium]|nr:rod shape-determining protein MreC [Bacteroidota bacterium]